MRKICINSKYGFINDQGEVVIKAIYEDAKDFNEGLAFVKYEKTWNLIDEYGRIYSTDFTRVNSFKDGLSAVSIKIEGVERWGFVNKTGRFVIEPQFDYVDNFNEGLAHVRINGKSGFINMKGKHIIYPRFKMAWDYSNQLVLLDNGGPSVYYYKLINGKLTSALPVAYDNGLSFSESLAAVTTRFSDKWGYIDLTGKLVIQPQFELALSFNEGIAPVAIDDPIRVDLWGYIDKEAKWVIEPKFDKADPFIDGIAQIYIDNKMGYINRDGDYIWEPTH